MIDPRHLRRYVIEPVLDYLDLKSEAAIRLLLGTAAQESRLGKYLHQVGGGPARGIYQMEPATHDDLWHSYLSNKVREGLRARVQYLRVGAFEHADQMEGNLYYATAMARIHYLRIRAALPDAEDLDGLAAYWKRYYNTTLGAGTTAEFLSNYRNLIGASHGK